MPSAIYVQVYKMETKLHYYSRPGFRCKQNPHNDKWPSDCSMLLTVGCPKISDQAL